MSVFMKTPARLHQEYVQHTRKIVMEKLGLTNVMAAPKIVKVVLSMGIGKATQDSKLLEEAKRDLELIAGQMPVITKAKKSIAAFKLREGMSIGLKVTLRRHQMYDFFDRLVYIALPRVKDFKGFTDHGFDGNGNFSFGIKEHTIFPEINADKVDKAQGLNITIVTNAKSNEEACVLLQHMKMPIHSKKSVS